MNAISALRALAAGRPLADSILGACRLESGCVDAFGSEAVGDAFRRAPIDNVEVGDALSCKTCAVVMTRDAAVFADVYESRLGRLWRIGQGATDLGEPAIAVAFDTDLHQTRADVFLAAADHPALSLDCEQRVREAGLALLDDSAFPNFRARAFVIRAFGDDASGAALFAIHALAEEPVRRPSLTHAVAMWQNGKLRSVRDPVAHRDLLTRIVA